jgi:hypothetical protein
MRQRNLLTAIRLLAAIIAAYVVAPSFAQKAKVPIQQDSRCHCTAERANSILDSSWQSVGIRGATGR